MCEIADEAVYSRDTTYHVLQKSGWMQLDEHTLQVGGRDAKLMVVRGKQLVMLEPEVASRLLTSGENLHFVQRSTTKREEDVYIKKKKKKQDSAGERLEPLLRELNSHMGLLTKLMMRQWTKNANTSITELPAVPVDSPGRGAKGLRVSADVHEEPNNETHRSWIQSEPTDASESSSVGKGKELIVTPEILDIMRKFARKNLDLFEYKGQKSVGPNTFEEDDEYCRLFLHKWNPLVLIERSQLIKKIIMKLNARKGTMGQNVPLNRFAATLGLVGVEKKHFMSEILEWRKKRPVKSKTYKESSDEYLTDSSAVSLVVINKSPEKKNKKNLLKRSRSSSSNASEVPSKESFRVKKMKTSPRKSKQVIKKNVREEAKHSKRGDKRDMEESLDETEKKSAKKPEAIEIKASGSGLAEFKFNKYQTRRLQTLPKRNSQKIKSISASERDAPKKKIIQKPTRKNKSNSSETVSTSTSTTSDTDVPKKKTIQKPSRKRDHVKVSSSKLKNIKVISPNKPAKNVDLSDEESSDDHSSVVLRNTRKSIIKDHQSPIKSKVSISKKSAYKINLTPRESSDETIASEFEVDHKSQKKSINANISRKPVKKVDATELSDDNSVSEFEEKSKKKSVNKRATSSSSDTSVSLTHAYISDTEEELEIKRSKVDEKGNKENNRDQQTKHISMESAKVSRKLDNMTSQQKIDKSRILRTPNKNDQTKEMHAHAGATRKKDLQQAGEEITEDSETEISSQLKDQGRRSSGYNHVKNRVYSMQEDRIILDHVLRGENNKLVKGTLMWKELQRVFFPLANQARTWQSLKNRYLKYILPNLAYYGLPHDKESLLRTGAFLGELKRKSPKQNSIYKVLPVISASNVLRLKKLKETGTARNDSSEPSTSQAAFSKQSEVTSKTSRTDNKPTQAETSKTSKRPHSKRKSTLDGVVSSTPKKSQKKQLSPSYSEVIRKFIKPRRGGSSGHDGSTSPQEKRSATRAGIRKLFNTKI